MVHAFVLLEAAAGTTEELVDRIRELEAVSAAYVVSGDHDVVVEIDADRIYDVLSTVTGGIRSLEGVGTTRTYISLE